MAFSDELRRATDLRALLQKPGSMIGMLEHLGQAIVVSDREGSVLLFSPEAERLLGMPPPEGTLAEWLSACSCLLPDTVTPYPTERIPIVRALRGEAVDNEVVYIRHTGQPEGVWIAVTARPLLDASGEIQGGVILLKDCSDHRRVIQRVESRLGGRGISEQVTSYDWADCLPAVEKLLRRYEWIYSAVEQTADSVVITDRKGVIQYVNPGFTETTGFGADEVMGQTPRVLKSGKHPPEFYEGLWKTILSGEPYRGLIINRKKSGACYTAQQTISPIRDERGKISHFVSVLRDVTDLIQAQEREFQMTVAQEIQERFYGADVSVPGYDIAGAAVQAQEVGGDYYDFFPMAGGFLGIAVGDVAGHGIGPALVMAETRAYLRAMAAQENDLGVILTRLNRALAEDLPDNRFVTLLFARLDPAKRSLVYANAGHVPGFLMGRSGEVKVQLDSLGPPLGIFADMSYSSSEAMSLEQGDVLLLLTDGVLETRDVNGEEFGCEGAVRFLSTHLDEPAGKILEGLQNIVRAFEADDVHRDDVTSIILKVEP